MSSLLTKEEEGYVPGVAGYLPWEMRRFSYCFTFVFLRLAHGFLWFFLFAHGFPIVFLLLFYGFPVVQNNRMATEDRLVKPYETEARSQGTLSTDAASRNDEALQEWANDVYVDKWQQSLYASSVSVELSP